MITWVRSGLFKIIKPEIDAYTTRRILDFYDALLSRNQISPIQKGAIIGDGVAYDGEAAAKANLTIVATQQPKDTE